MKLVPTETQDSTPVMIPTDKTLSEIHGNALALKVPTGIVESIKTMRYELSLLHTQMTKEFGVIPAYLGYAYQALNDAEQFLKKVLAGDEDFTPVPPKAELTVEDTTVVSDSIVVPSKLEDVHYMQEWSSAFFFPKLREYVKRKDIEVDIKGSVKEETIWISFGITVEGKAAVEYDTSFKAGDKILLLDLASFIDSL